MNKFKRLNEFEWFLLNSKAIIIHYNLIKLLIERNSTVVLNGML